MVCDQVNGPTIWIMNLIRYIKQLDDVQTTLLWFGPNAAIYGYNAYLAWDQVKDQCQTM